MKNLSFEDHLELSEKIHAVHDALRALLIMIETTDRKSEGAQITRILRWLGLVAMTYEDIMFGDHKEQCEEYRIQHPEIANADLNIYPIRSNYV